MQANSHPADPEELMAYLDGELPVARATVAADHLAHCRDCQAVAADLQSVSRRLMTWQVEVPEGILPPAPEPLPQKPKAQPKLWDVFGWVGVLATACLVLLVVAAPKISQQRLVDVAGPARELQQPQATKRFVRVDGMPGEDAPPPQADGRLEPTSTNGPLVIHTGQVTLTTADFAKTRDALEALVQHHGGHIGQLNVSTPAGSARSLQATLRVPADHLAAFMVELRKLGHVEMESQAGEEVTRQVTDLEARLSNSRITEQRLAEILRQRTGKISDVLEVEKEINRVRGEIEIMAAERKNFGDRIAFATLQVSVSEEYKAELQAPSSFGKLRNAAVDGYRNVTGSLVAASLFLLSAGPTLLVWAAILFFPVRFLWWRYRRTR